MPHLTTRRGRMTGFTLIELVVAVVILAILAMIALPNFQNMIRSNRVATATNSVIGAVSLARTEAVRNTRGAGVCASADGSTCATSTNWSSGLLVWSDRDGDGTYGGSATDTALRWVQGNNRMVVTGPSDVNAIRFNPRGRLVGAAQTLALQPDTCGSKAFRRTLQISTSGQVRKNGAFATCL